jgi:hypothetical protein
VLKLALPVSLGAAALVVLSPARAQDVAWAHLDGSGSTDRAYRVAVSTDGSTYTYGYSNGQPTFGADGPVARTLPTPPSGSLNWISRRGPAGDFEWVASMESGIITTNSDTGLDATPDGGVLLARGVYGHLILRDASGGVAVSWTTTSRENVIHREGLVAKLGSSGALQWSHRLRATGPVDPRLDITHSCVNPDGTTVAGGRLLGNLTVGSVSVDSGVSESNFLIAFDFAGNPLWARRMPGTSAMQMFLAADRADGFVVTNVFVSAVTFPEGPFITATRGHYLARFDITDGQLRELSTLVIAGSTLPIVRDIAVAPGGRVAACGDYLEGPGRTAPRFGDQNTSVAGAESEAAADGRVGFVVMFDATNTIQWASFIESGRASPQVELHGIAALDDGAFGIAGGGVDRITVGALQAGTAGGLYQGLLLRISATGSPDWLRAFGGDASGEALLSDAAPGSNGAVTVAGEVFGTVLLDSTTALTALRADADALTARFDTSRVDRVDLVGLADIARECDGNGIAGTVNFLFRVEGSLPPGATVQVRNRNTGADLVAATTDGVEYGVGPYAFPLGNTVIDVTVLAADGATELAAGSFTVTIQDTTPPVILGAGPFAAECAGAATPLIASELGLSVDDDCDDQPSLTFAPASLPLGIHQVVARAEDASGNVSERSVEVTIRDTIPPQFTTFPDDIREECVAGSRRISFAIDAEDSCPAGVTILCAATDLNDPNRTFPVDPTGTAFPLGDFLVRCEAVDGSGNRAAPRSFLVSIIDVTDPVLLTPDDGSYPNDPGLCTARVRVFVDAVDNCSATTLEVRIGDEDGPLLTNDADHDFPVGTTTVWATAQDRSGNRATATYRVTVLDVESPVVLDPATTTLVTDCGGSPLSVGAGDLGLAAQDNCDASPRLTFTPSTLSPGTTTVTVTATDAAGNQGVRSFQVTVLKGPFHTALLRPLDDGVDNRIRAGRAIPVKLRVACDGLAQGDVVATIESVQLLGSDGTPVANEVPEEAGLSGDGGATMRWSEEGFWMFNLDTSSWTATSGLRHLVTLRVERSGHVDTYHTFKTVNR